MVFIGDKKKFPPTKVNSIFGNLLNDRHIIVENFSVNFRNGLKHCLPLFLFSKTGSLL